MHSKVEVLKEFKRGKKDDGFGETRRVFQRTRLLKGRPGLPAGVQEAEDLLFPEEKQNAEAQQDDAVHSFDLEWKQLSQDLDSHDQWAGKRRKTSVENAHRNGSIEPTCPGYDRLTRELLYEKRAPARERLKTSGELARERSLQLEQQSRRAAAGTEEPPDDYVSDMEHFLSTPSATHAAPTSPDLLGTAAARHPSSLQIDGMPEDDAARQLGMADPEMAEMRGDGEVADLLSCGYPTSACNVQQTLSNRSLSEVTACLQRLIRGSSLLTDKADGKKAFLQSLIESIIDGWAACGSAGWSQNLKSYQASLCDLAAELGNEADETIRHLMHGCVSYDIPPDDSSEANHTTRSTGGFRLLRLIKVVDVLLDLTGVSEKEAKYRGSLLSLQIDVLETAAWRLFGWTSDDPRGNLGVAPSIRPAKLASALSILSLLCSLLKRSRRCSPLFCALTMATVSMLADRRRSSPSDATLCQRTHHLQALLIEGLRAETGGGVAVDALVDHIVMASLMCDPDMVAGDLADSLSSCRLEGQAFPLSLQFSRKKGIRLLDPSFGDPSDTHGTMRRDGRQSEVDWLKRQSKADKRFLNRKIRREREFLSVLSSKAEKRRHSHLAKRERSIHADLERERGMVTALRTRAVAFKGGSVHQKKKGRSA
ncbi:unnamed protein product [Vitrella brassicaformis CCMP3155]|uniref:Nucleolar protein 14 n=1 Tax=Vitrella brassicaformis (strain CCMP3155) TaxID=1169540 RepID=A0A0G4ED59_VITBC|nr:unnamed protein product [Vitrella brassicaformis CCMP3155]|eukprot:CEL93285.1 unnamed protein product [Vitrella brassicaformis CCMP3155]